MKSIKLFILLASVISLTSCASSYQVISPKYINYQSTNENSKVTLAYKYDLLDKKYAKKEINKGVRLIAVKLTNESGRDLIFGQDIKLSYANGNVIEIMDSDRVFKSLKQSVAPYLLYLLLTPTQFFSTSSDGTTNTVPIGVVLGPGIAGGNMIGASSANSNFKNELLNYDINGTVIKNGEVKYGLIGIRSDSFDALKLIVK